MVLNRLVVEIFELVVDLAISYFEYLILLKLAKKFPSVGRGIFFFLNAGRGAILVENRWSRPMLSKPFASRPGIGNYREKYN